MKEKQGTWLLLLSEDLRREKEEREGNVERERDYGEEEEGD